MVATLALRPSTVRTMLTSPLPASERGMRTFTWSERGVLALCGEAQNVGLRPANGGSHGLGAADTRAEEVLN